MLGSKLTFLSDQEGSPENKELKQHLANPIRPQVVKTLTGMRFWQLAAFMGKMENPAQGHLEQKTPEMVAEVVRQGYAVSQAQTDQQQSSADIQPLGRREPQAAVALL